VNVIPLKTILQSFGGVELTADEEKDIRFGRKIKREVQPDTLAWYDGLPVAVLIPCRDGSRMAQPRKVL
jgi:hypothetical protein